MLFKKILNGKTCSNTLDNLVVEREGTLDPRELYLKIELNGFKKVIPYGNALSGMPDLLEGGNIIKLSTHNLEDASDEYLAEETQELISYNEAPRISFPVRKTNDKKINLNYSLDAGSMDLEGVQISIMQNATPLPPIIIDAVPGDNIINIPVNGKEGISKLTFSYVKDSTTSKTTEIEIMIDSISSGKPIVFGIGLSQETVISFGWNNTELEMNDISKYRYKITGETSWTEIPKTMTSITKDVKVNGSYSIEVQSCDSSELNWSESGTFTTVVSSLNVNSLKMVEIGEQKIIVNSKFTGLTTMPDTSYITSRVPMLYIENSVAENRTSPSVIDSNFINNLIVNIKNVANSKVSTEEKHECYKLIVQLLLIKKQYGNYPFGLCINNKSFKSFKDSTEDVDVMMMDMLISDKRIKALVDYSPESHNEAYFTSMEEFCQENSIFYIGVDKRLDVAKNSEYMKFNYSEKVSPVRYTVESLTNFSPEFAFYNCIGITDSQFKISLSEISDEYLAREIFEIFFSGATLNKSSYSEFVKFDGDAASVVLPVLAKNFYSNYNGIVESFTWNNIDVGFIPVKYMRALGFKNDDIADDFKSANMTSLVKEDGFISKIVFKNEHYLNLKEVHVNLGVGRVKEVVYSTLKELEEDKKIKKSLKILIDIQLKASLAAIENVAKSIVCETSFETREQSGIKKEILVVKIKLKFKTEYGIIEIENQLTFD